MACGRVTYRTSQTANNGVLLNRHDPAGLLCGRNEKIDIGGPSMVRAAAKNHPAVAVVTSPERYADVIAAAQGEPPGWRTP